MDSKNFKYRDLIFVLIYEYQVISQLFDGEEKYAKLLQELRSYTGEYDPFPLQKDLLEKLNLQRKSLMSLMQNLYHDFQIKISQPNTYPVSEIEIWLIAKTFEDYWTIGVDKLEFLPQPGDEFILPMIRNAVFGSRSFIVEEISHELENGKHTINVFMNDRIESKK